MAKEIEDLRKRTADEASVEMLLKACEDCVETCYDREDAQKNHCAFGRSGVCCRICHMGPCRITKNSPRGVCGADEDTIVARNYLREVTGGAAAHSDHGRHLVLLLKKTAEGHGGYAIKDERALRSAARLYGIEELGRAKEAVALELANLMLGEFSSQEEPLKTLDLAPLKRVNLWKAKDIEPKGIDRMCVEAMHRTTMGVDHDYKSLLMHAFRTSLADGWGGSRVATMASDILFGSPAPVKSRANLGVLGENTVNIVIHGHEPALSEMLTIAVQDPEIKEYAKQAGAAGGVTLAGICCTANEILMRHGIPVAGNVLQQELAVVTGAVEMMVVDVQCCMPSLPTVAKQYHTEIISTADIARTVGAIHMEFGEDNPLESAKALIRRAIDNYAHRDRSRMSIPRQSEPLIAGFSVDAIKYMLGGRYRASFRPLNDAVMQGRIAGIVGIVGCNNPKKKTDEYSTALTRELLKRNVLVLKTGCAAIAAGKAGLMKPEVGLEMAGPGLREVCEAVGMPPVLHMGSCVDNSRLLEAATEIVKEGGLGDDLSMAPVVGVAPEWMSEKAVAIGCYFVASGIDVILGNPFYTSGSQNVTKFLNEDAKEMFGASFHLCEDPQEAVGLIMSLLNDRRDKLGINKKAERKLYDMKDRRSLDV